MIEIIHFTTKNAKSGSEILLKWDHTYTTVYATYILTNGVGIKELYGCPYHCLKHFVVKIFGSTDTDGKEPNSSNKGKDNQKEKENGKDIEEKGTSDLLHSESGKLCQL